MGKNTNANHNGPCLTSEVARVDNKLTEGKFRSLDLTLP